MSNSHGNKAGAAKNKANGEGDASKRGASSDRGTPSETAADESFDKSQAVGVDSTFNSYRDFSESDYAEQEHDESTGQSSFASSESVSFPPPDVFSSYPIEVQRKIMEWTDRDIKARRDDESRRQDELMRAQLSREKMKQIIPAVIVILAIICAAATGIITMNPWFAAAFLIIPLAIIIGEFVIAKKARPKTKPDYRNHQR